MNLFPSIYVSKALGLPLVLGLALSACDGGVLPDDMSSASSDSFSSEALSSDAGVSSVTTSSEGVASESSSLIVAVSSMVASSSSVVRVSSSQSFSSVAESSSVVPVSSSQVSTISSAESSAAVSSAAVSSDAVSSEAVSSDAVSSEMLSSEAASSIASSIASSSSSTFSSSSSSALPVGCEVSDTRFDLNDVSFLFPLPKNEEELASMLTLDSPGLGGELARDDQQREPLLVTILNRDSELREKIKVVGVRIDPCAPTDNDGVCGKELRLVLQPIGSPGESFNKHFSLDNEELRFTATDYVGIDQVLHYMYVLTDDNFELLTEELEQLKALAGSETSCIPLSIHPVMAREGLGGQYATTLMSMIQRYAGEDNLQRIAFTAARPTPLWFFGEMHRESRFNVADLIGVPRGAGVNPALQFEPAADPKNHKISSTFFNIGEGSTLDALAFLDDTEQPNQTLLNSALSETLMIENPKLSNPMTIDCVSCHVGERLRDQTIGDPRIVIDEAIWDNLYSNSRYDMTPTTDGLGFASLRMFGYMLRKPHVAQRVVNDSAESADRFNAQ